MASLFGTQQCTWSSKSRDPRAQLKDGMTHTVVMGQGKGSMLSEGEAVHLSPACSGLFISSC